MFDGRQVDLAVTLDRDALAAWVAERAAAIHIASRSAKIVATPTGWTATTPREGKLLDVPATIRAIEAALLDRTATTASVEAPVTTVQPDVDRLDTVLAISAAERITAPLTVNFRDDASWTIPAETLRAAIQFRDGGDRPSRRSTRRPVRARSRRSRRTSSAQPANAPVEDEDRPVFGSCRARTDVTSTARPPASGSST